jgi:prenyltransferase beta subunit
MHSSTVNLDTAMERARKWLEEKRRNSNWRVPVISKHPLSAAAALLVIPDEQKWKTIDYLLRTKVWEKDSEAALLLVKALLNLGERDAANTVAKNLKENRWRSVGARFKPIEAFYLNSLSFLTLALVPEHFWYSRNMLTYDVFPPFIHSIQKSAGTKLKERIMAILPKTMNSDGSHSGFTVPTIWCASFLQDVGETRLFRKALNWIQEVRNPDGSYKPLLFLDIFDTAWACAALAHDKPEDSVEWIQKHHVNGGFPYYSFSYCTDVDDTSCVTFASVLCGNVNDVTRQSVEWLLHAQNPDGGWGTYPKYRKSYAAFFSILSQFPSFVSGMSRLHTHRSASMVDMTARAMIALSYFRERKDVRKAVRKGAAFLLQHQKSMRFRGFQRWIGSDVYETSLALVALLKNGVQDTRTDDAVRWLLEQRLEVPEEAAHILWVLSETNVAKERQEEIIGWLMTHQNEDGSWNPLMPLISYGSPYFCPVFTTAFTLFCLNQSRSLLNTRISMGL